MPKRGTRWYRKNEQQVMKQLGFSPTINSGAGWVQKEDGESEHCLCQLKSTDMQSISVKLLDLKTLVHNSMVAHKVPVFALQFIQTDDVWLLVRPQDIGLLEDLHAGKQVEIKQNEFDNFFEETVDNSDDELYNRKCDEAVISANASQSYLARVKYHEQTKMEAEQREMENKQKQKERRTAWKRSSNRKV